MHANRTNDSGLNAGTSSPGPPCYRQTPSRLVWIIDGASIYQGSKTADGCVLEPTAECAPGGSATSTLLRRRRCWLHASRPVSRNPWRTRRNTFPHHRYHWKTGKTAHCDTQPPKRSWPLHCTHWSLFNAPHRPPPLWLQHRTVCTPLNGVSFPLWPN